jgi:hypothetical protein
LQGRAAAANQKNRPIWGGLAERLRSGLQIREDRFDSDTRLHAFAGRKGSVWSNFRQMIDKTDTYGQRSGQFANAILAKFIFAARQGRFAQAKPVSRR